MVFFRTVENGFVKTRWINNETESLSYSALVHKWPLLTDFYHPKIDLFCIIDVHYNTKILILYELSEG